MAKILISRVAPSKSSRDASLAIYYNRKSYASTGSSSHELCFMQSFWRTENSVRSSDRLLLRIDHVRYPIDRFSYTMVNSWLTRLGTRISRRNDANQVPSSRLLQHQRSSAVALRKETVWGLKSYSHLRKFHADEYRKSRRMFPLDGCNESRDRSS